MATAAPRRLSWARVIVRVIQVALIVIIAWGIYHVLEGELRQLTWEAVARLRPEPLTLLVSFGLLISTYFAHALLWRRIMRDLKIGNPTTRETIRIFFTASLGRYLPGKLWQVAGMAVLAGRAGLRPISATAAAILGQMAFLATGMLFLVLMLPQWQSLVGMSGAVIVGVIILIALGGSMVYLLAATPFGHGAREWLLARTARFGPNTTERLRAAFALADRVTLRVAFVWAVAYFLTWVAIGGAFILFVTSFVPTPDVEQSTRYLAGTIAASYFLGYLVPIPAGLGVREGVMLWLLTPVLQDTGGAALVISVLSRVWFTVAELAPLAIVPALPNSSQEDGPA